ncbi:hypothetical protein GHT06_009297 [Daphnia sinensis]|uniref:F-box domain-containing protein n=1 Tax=Daphnia sinensis TaxID=1820382 RepID=A0AAD5LNV5_9CRUS|nr:hypothetical protein GHT06_009297 [Daphnia sinensis]
MDSNGEKCDILRLPSELLLLLMELLSGKDLINFSLTCSRILDVSRNFLRLLQFENCWRTGISVGDFKAHLSLSVDPIQLTECNFNNCYWLPAIFLQNFIKKCENLEVLKISETKLNCGHLAHIFGKCKKITHLSMTLSQDDLKLTKKDERNGSQLSPDGILRKTCLKDCYDSMQKLNKLELVLFHSSLREATIFLSFCDNLKELTLIPVKDQDPSIHMNNPFCEVKGKFLLNSLVVVNMEDDSGGLRIPQQSSMRRYQEYFVFKTDMKHLKNHWNDASPCPVIKDRFSSLTFKHLRIPRGMFEVWWIEKNVPSRAANPTDHELMADGWYLNDPLENLDLECIRSIREPFPVFIKKGLKAPNARLISCFYSDQGFSDFCLNHPHLKALKLKAPPVYDDWGNAMLQTKNQVVGEEWYSNSWENLAGLKAFSIEPSLLAVDHKRERPVRKRKFGESFYNAAESNPFRPVPVLGAVFKSCLQIEELEIGVFTDVGEIFRIDGEDLAGITQCKRLRKLTLASINIVEGVFLEEVIPKVEEPRITPFVLLYKTSMRRASYIFQRNMVPLAKLLDSIEQCSALTRLGLVVPSDAAPFKWSAGVLTQRVVKFCMKLQNLVAFFCVMNIPKSHKATVVKQLLHVMSPRRPSFCVDIQASGENNLDHESFSLPLVHREILVHCNSRIGVVPYDFKSFLL